MSNMNNTNNEEEIFDPQEMFVTLDLDDGSQLECQILTIFDVDNQNYILTVMMNLMLSVIGLMSYWMRKNLIRCNYI